MTSNAVQVLEFIRGRVVDLWANLFSEFAVLDALSQLTDPGAGPHEANNHLAPITRPHISPSLNQPPPHSRLSLPTSTTQPTLDRLSVLCGPVFEQERSRQYDPIVAWAGIFDSVQSRTQRPDSIIKFLVGYAAGADFRDVSSSSTKLWNRLSEILGRGVVLMDFTQNNHDFEYIDLETLLTAKTIWGDPSFVHSSREAAERQLREGYEATKKALQVASRLEAKLPSSLAEFISPENKTLRLSILADALFIITTVKIPNNPFYNQLRSFHPRLLAKEDAIRAALEGEVESIEDLGDIWNVVSDWINVVALEAMMQAAEQTFSCAGLEPLRS